jgi:hypothetical protein
MALFGGFFAASSTRLGELNTFINFKELQRFRKLPSSGVWLKYRMQTRPVIGSLNYRRKEINNCV